MHEIKDKTVFISALDWGLGHASRCVPIIQDLIEKGHSVTIAAGGTQKKILQYYDSQKFFFY